MYTVGEVTCWLYIFGGRICYHSRLEILWQADDLRENGHCRSFLPLGPWTGVLQLEAGSIGQLQAKHDVFVTSRKRILYGEKFHVEDIRILQSNFGALYCLLVVDDIPGWGGPIHDWTRGRISAEDDVGGRNNEPGL